MTDECPVCGQEFSAVMNVEQGRSFSDAAGMPVHTFFSKYIMAHRQKEGGKMKVYVHKEV